MAAAAELAECGDKEVMICVRLLEQFHADIKSKKFQLPKYQRSSASRVKVCVRKRPLLAAQQEESAFDVLSCIDRHTLLCHEPRMNVRSEQSLSHQVGAFYSAVVYR